MGKKPCKGFHIWGWWPSCSAEASSEYQARKTISFHPSTEKLRWFYVEDDTMGKLFGLGVKSECGFFILKFKMASKMAAKK